MYGSTLEISGASRSAEVFAWLSALGPFWKMAARLLSSPCRPWSSERQRARRVHQRALQRHLMGGEDAEELVAVDDQPAQVAVLASEVAADLVELEVEAVELRRCAGRAPR